jgi:hypothetical protein
MVSFCAVCGCCTRTDIVREHLENTLRICDVSAMGLFMHQKKKIASKVAAKLQAQVLKQALL